MSNTNEGRNSGSRNQFAWLFISLIAVVIISVILPFPISFVVSIIIILLISMIRVDITLKKAGMGGISGWYKSMSSYETGRGWGMGNNLGYKPLTFSCMTCGTPHNKIACPKCGSKAVKAG